LAVCRCGALLALLSESARKTTSSMRHTAERTAHPTRDASGGSTERSLPPPGSGS
jgi:hypothetical protein